MTRSDPEALAKPASEPAGGDAGANLAAAVERYLKHTYYLDLDEALDAFRALSSSAGPAEPVAWAPKDHLQRYLKGQNTACWVYGSPTSETDVALYAHPAPATVESANKAEAILRQCRRFIAAEHKHAERAERGEDTTRDDVDFQHAQLVGDFTVSDCDEALRMVRRRRAALAPATEGRKG